MGTDPSRVLPIDRMKINKATYRTAAGYPFLAIELEGFDAIAVIDGEAARQLHGRKWGAVFLGAAFQSLLPPMEREGNRITGYTDDPAVVMLAERFIRDCDAGTFRDGYVVMDKDWMAVTLKRMGDFYEAFGEQAKCIAAILGLTITTRNKAGTNPLAMAGFPYHQLHAYVEKLRYSGVAVEVLGQDGKPENRDA